VSVELRAADDTVLGHAEGSVEVGAMPFLPHPFYTYSALTVSLGPWTRVAEATRFAVSIEQGDQADARSSAENEAVEPR